MNNKKILFDEISIKKSIKRISHEILERNHKVKDVVLVGIKRRGEIIAKRIQAEILNIENSLVATLGIDVYNYRDDILEKRIENVDINYNFKDKIVILIDDVLHKGRTARAGIEYIIQNGRASQIQLAILVDRGHRELPIKPDYIGKNIPTAKNEEIICHLKEIDGEDVIYITKD